MSARRNDRPAEGPSLNKDTQSSRLSEFAQFEDDDRETMVSVNDVSMVFNMASQRLTNLKEYAIALARRELMFKEFRALQHISLEVKRGDVFGILGTNGSGKSTLLKIIAGVLEPTEGTVEIHGNIAPLIELGAGFDFELTARENIYLNGALLGYPKPFIAEHFNEIVEFAEIRDFLDLPLKNYSSGMVARIAFAIATVIVPDILIVDEVLSVGDTMFQQKCERRIQTLISEYNTTVLIVSHNTEQVERLCNKAIWIEKSHPRLLGPADAVCAAYRALGGHRGSAESETLIYGLLEEPADYPSDYFETIGGDSVYGTAMRLFNRTQEEYTAALSAGNAGEHAGGDTKAVPIPTVILTASGNRAALSLLPWLAGALKAIPLVTSVDLLPDGILSSIRSNQTERVILLDENQEIDPCVAKTIREECPTVASLVTIEATSDDELAQKAFDFVMETTACDNDVTNGALENASNSPAKEYIYSKTALLMVGMIDSHIEAFSPLMYRYRIPVLFCTDADNEAASHYCNLLKAFRNRGITDVVVFGKAPELGTSSALASSVDGQGVSLHNIDDLWPYQQYYAIQELCEKVSSASDASKAPQNPQATQATQKSPVSQASQKSQASQTSQADAHSLIFASTNELADAFLCAPLAINRQAIVVMVDKDNLDSVAGAIKTIRGKGPVLPPFDHLVFLGGNMCFDDPIKDILAKVAWVQRETLIEGFAEEQEH